MFSLLHFLLLFCLFSNCCLRHACKSAELCHDTLSFLSCCFLNLIQARLRGPKWGFRPRTASGPERGIRAPNGFGPGKGDSGPERLRASKDPLWTSSRRSHGVKPPEQLLDFIEFTSGRPPVGLDSSGFYCLLFWILFDLPIPTWSFGTE